MTKKKKKNRKPFKRLLIFLTVCAVLLVGVKLGYNSIMQYLYPVKYSEYVEKYAQEYEVDKYLLYAVIHTESGFDPNAVSSAQARGLTQITQDTFDWLLTKTNEEYTFDDLFEPEISIKYCAMFYSILLEEYEVTETAVAAYHAGMGNVSNWLCDSRYSSDGIHLDTTPISDTNHYISKVMSAMDNYYTIYNQEEKNYG